MKKIKLVATFIITVSIFLSCNYDKDGCTDTIIVMTDLESEYGCTNTKYQMNIPLSDNYMIIRNQRDYVAFVSLSCQPTIDFSLYDLVIGKKGLSNGNSSIDYELMEDCSTGNQTFTVTFNQNDTTEAPNLTYHGLIPKLGDEQDLNVEIIIN